MTQQTKDEAEKERFDEDRCLRDKGDQFEGLGDIIYRHGWLVSIVQGRKSQTARGFGTLMEEMRGLRATTRVCC